MEADAKHDFTASAADELTFKKNSVIKILSVEDDPNWYMAEQDGHTGLVPCNYISIRPNLWYIYGCGRTQAEERLLETNPQSNQYVQPDGAFLLRKSQSSDSGFSLSVKDASKVLHFKVLQDEQGKYFLWLCKFESINMLIQYHRKVSISRDRLLCLVDMKPSQIETLVNKPNQIQRVIARFDFTSKDSGELSFHRGDVIEVLSQDDEFWWRGRIRATGVSGLFPVNYVERLPAIMPS